MKKYTRLMLALVLSIALGACSDDTDDQVSTGTGTYSSESTELSKTLDTAIADEYKARATYTAVLNKFGDVRPFSNIRQTESSHIQSLIGLYYEYGFEVPADNWDGTVSAPDSLQAACQIGVTAEIENAAMYDELLLAAADYPDVIAIFIALQAASLDKHLPAFQRCS